ncbi:MAG: ATP-grasp domain-containing protein [Gemmataceae bacterium]
MKAATIWFNHNLSTTYNAIAILRAADEGRFFRVLCTHSDKDFPGFEVSDVHEVEPRGLKEADYLHYCLDVIQRHAVDVFLPGRHQLSVVRHRQRFEERGVRLLAAADADTLQLLEDKAAVYAALRDNLVPVPEYRRVTDGASFLTAYAELRARVGRVCFKPASSLYGLGFHILTEDDQSWDRILAGDHLKISIADVERWLQAKGKFRPLLVMQYLPSVERSVDCLAQDGQLIRCVVRRKPVHAERTQLLEHNPVMENMVQRLTARLRLNGLFNVQFREDDAGVSRLLEINPRMAGGLLVACMSGVAFPYWAARLALGAATAADIPQPRTGIRVAQVVQALQVTTV